VELADRHLALVTGDAYSLSLDGDRWQWTLLRSPKMAWGGGEPVVYAGRDQYTDQGPHTFDFVLCVEESLEETMLHTAARQQMQPPVVFDRYEGMDRPPWPTGGWCTYWRTKAWTPYDPSSRGPSGPRRNRET
jgi:alpha-mannosidase